MAMLMQKQSLGGDLEERCKFHAKFTGKLFCRILFFDKVTG